MGWLVKRDPDSVGDVAWNTCLGVVEVLRGELDRLGLSVVFQADGTVVGKLFREAAFIYLEVGWVICIPHDSIRRDLGVSFIIERGFNFSLALVHGD